METEKQELKKRKLEEQLNEYKQWKDLSWPAQHWRAWGSWFSWGSPVGLGIFFVLLGFTFVIIKFGINL